MSNFTYSFSSHGSDPYLRSVESQTITLSHGGTTATTIAGTISGLEIVFDDGRDALNFAYHSMFSLPRIGDSIKLPNNYKDETFMVSDVVWSLGPYSGDVSIKVNIQSDDPSAHSEARKEIIVRRVLASLL